MTTIRCSAWTILTLAILVDVAPGGSCRSQSDRPVYTYLSIAASDCSCAQGALSVSIDGRQVAEITCGASGGVSIEVSPGSHTVSAVNSTASWPARSYDAATGRTTRVELGCPSRAL